MRKRDILRAFKRLRVLVLADKIPHRTCGICMNVDSLLTKEQKRNPRTGESFFDWEILFVLYEGWPQHSGERSYPIESGLNKWWGKQLELRLSLIDYVIAKLAKYDVKKGGAK